MWILNTISFFTNKACLPFRPNKNPYDKTKIPTVFLLSGQENDSFL